MHISKEEKSNFLGFCSFQYDSKRFLAPLCTLLDLPIIDGRHPALSFETVFIIYHATGSAFNTHLKMFNMFKIFLFSPWFFVVLKWKILKSGQMTHLPLFFNTPKIPMNSSLHMWNYLLISKNILRISALASNKKKYTLY